jgi:hypothetical protein
MQDEPTLERKTKPNANSLFKRPPLRSSRNANLTITDNSGNIFGPYALNLNENSGGIGHSDTPGLVLNSIEYDAITGNINDHGRGGGNLHLAHPGTTADDNPWSADGVPVPATKAAGY